MADDVKTAQRRMRLRRYTVSTLSVSESTANNPLLLLPDEIIVEILLRLPVRPLLQFKCVCKSWKTTISHPQFVKNQLQISTAYPQLVSSNNIDRGIVFYYPVEPLFENPSTPIQPVKVSNCSIIGSCNGLLCLYNIDQFCVKLWNPSVNLISKTSPTFNGYGHDGFITHHAFGFDQLNDKYKVLLALQNKHTYSKKITLLYTFGENSWKKIQNCACDPISWLGKYVSGTLNWVNKDGVNSSERTILSFDLEKETYSQVLLPQQDADNVCNHDLYVLRNCLCVCFNHSKETHWGVWMMKEYGVAKSWTKLMIIPHKKLTRNCPRRFHIDPLFVSENGAVLVRTRRRLVLYNLNNGRLSYKLGWDIYMNHQSLVSPLW
jgi:F-box interacting protein